MPIASELHGSTWAGKNELWMDPLGHEASISDCRIRIDPEGIAYEWSHGGTPHRGRLTLRPDGAEFVDTFHSQEPMKCRTRPGGRALIDVEGTYGESNGTSWGWRITVCTRPSMDETPGALVLQMANITPWGEEGRAVRMIAERIEDSP